MFRSGPVQVDYNRVGGHKNTILGFGLGQSKRLRGISGSGAKNLAPQNSVQTGNSDC